MNRSEEFNKWRDGAELDSSQEMIKTPLFVNINCAHFYKLHEVFFKAGANAAYEWLSQMPEGFFNAELNRQLGEK